MIYRVAILIVSDRVALGEREDGCRAVFDSAFEGTPFSIVDTAVCSDDPERIRETLMAILKRGPDLLFTSGGSGCSARDNTPEVTVDFLERRTPGIDEAIRRLSSDVTPFAIYSRAVSGFAGATLIINLPGSPGAVSEILEFLLPTLEHPIKLRRGEIIDCAD